jgi:hypothetical protein
VFTVWDEGTKGHVVRKIRTEARLTVALEVIEDIIFLLFYHGVWKSSKDKDW